MNYEALEVEIIVMPLEDIITTSLGTDTPTTGGNEGSWDML